MNLKVTQISCFLCELLSNGYLFFFMTSPGKPVQLKTRDIFEYFELKWNLNIFFKWNANECSLDL